MKSCGISGQLTVIEETVSATSVRAGCGKPIPGASAPGNGRSLAESV